MRSTPRQEYEQWLQERLISTAPPDVWPPLCFEEWLGRPFENLLPQEWQMKAEKVIDGIPVNPVLPKGFSSTPNEERPVSHRKWWDTPYIQTNSVEELDAEYANRTDEYAEKAREAWVNGRVTWMAAWPTGTRYDVRCLDGGAWDRPTCWGMFPSLEQAVECAKLGPIWRK